MRDFRPLLREFPDLSYDELLEIDRLRRRDEIAEQRAELDRLRRRKESTDGR